MATSAMTSGASASALACALCHCVGLLQMPSPSDVDQVLVASRLSGAKSTALTDMHDASSPLSSAASSSDGDRNDVASHDVPTFGMVQLKAGFVRLYQLVTALVVQVAVIASDVVSLKDRIIAVEGTHTPALVHGQETEALARQVNELCERVASQEDRIASLEHSQCAETESYKETIQELTTKLDDMKLDDDKKTRDDAFEKFCQSLKNFQQSMECQAARITGVKADTARKIALLQSELGGVQAELAAVKTIAVPVNAPSAKEARRARILASVAQRIEDAEMAEGKIDKLCPLPPVVARSSACVTVFQDMPPASTSSGGSSIAHPNCNKTEETTVKNLKITKEPLTTARTNVIQPGANKIPAIPMIPIPTIPMERLIPAKGSGKENRPCYSSTTALQDTKTFQPGAGRSPDVSDKPPTASPKKAQLGAGLPLKISALPKARRSMLPAPRKSQFPSLAKHAAVVDGSPPDVNTAYRPPGGSETRTELPKTVECAPIATSRAPLVSALSTLVEKERSAVLPASPSLASLDAALQAMQLDCDDLLAPMPALNCSNGDLSFSAITPILMKTKRNRDDKYESIYVPPKQRSVDVKPSRSPLKSTPATRTVNEVSLPASSSLTALDHVALQMLRGEGDILTFLPGFDYPSVDFSFSAVTPGILLKARPHCKRESIYVSPLKTATVTVKPSRRL